MTAFTVWGNTGNQAFALPMDQLTPSDPTTQGYLLAWNIITQALGYFPISTDFSSGDSTALGNFGVAVGKVYKVNGIQVVSSRVTGWTAATGTATRTTFVTGTVTLPQLAERVKALIDDLTAHGLIGA